MGQFNRKQLVINHLTRILRKALEKKTFSGLLVFVLVVIVYVRGGKIFASGDTIPSSLAALNLLKNGTIFFDNFRDSYLNSSHAYWFSETDRGNLVSSYPIGVSILTFPIYAIFHLLLLFFKPGLDITSQDFESYRLLLEKISATLITSLSVVIFYFASRLNFSVKVSLTTAFIYSFATSTWSTSSMALWQHGSANLALVTGFYFILLANKSPCDKSLLFRLFLAGICFGFLPAVRPTSALFSLAFLAYSIYYYRWRALFFLLGFFSYLPSLAWNFYNFGSFSGGYSNLVGHASPYKFSLRYFVTTALANLVSPSRGLLAASPVLAFSSLGLLELSDSSKSGRDKWLIYTFCLGALAVFIQYSFFVLWTAGYSLGPRFMTDILIPLCYLINYSLSMDRWTLWKPGGLKWWRVSQYIIFLSLLIFSVVVQVAFSNGYHAYSWNVYPVDISFYQNRAWHLKDNQIQRHFYALFKPFDREALASVENLSGMAGSIREVQIQKYEGSTNPLSWEGLDLAEGYQPPSQRVVFPPQELVQVRAIIENTGFSDWYGVSSALVNGETRVRLRIYEGNTLIAEHLLSPLSFKTQPGQNDVAVSVFSLPSESGEFQMIFDFMVNGLEEFPVRGNSSYVVGLILS